MCIFQNKLHFYFNVSLFVKESCFSLGLDLSMGDKHTAPLRESVSGDKCYTDSGARYVPCFD